METIFYTNEEIEKAREMNLLTYLRLYEPENLVKVHGEVYCTRQHDSLKISNGKWMWWSRGFGGASALDYLTKVKEISFSEAMGILLTLSVNHRYRICFPVRLLPIPAYLPVFQSHVLSLCMSRS